MTKLTFLRLSGLAAVLAVTMFVLGIAYHKYRFFPYELTRVAILKLTKGPADTSETPSEQYSRDFTRLPQEREIDTALLPLKVNGVRLTEYFSTPKVGGGVTSIGNKVVILDRLGNIYSCERGGRNLKKLPFPQLENNVAEYLAQPDGTVDDKKFRAYDIKYLDSEKKLAVSHEYFDQDQKKSRLAVSVINIDDKLLQPTGSWERIFLGDLEPRGPNEEGGGHLAVNGGSKIFLSIGEYQLVDEQVSQDAKSKMGKIFEIDVKTHEAKVISVGHRNPEGLVMTTSGLLSTEHGPAGGDELNLITEGGNYGWPIVTLGTDYDSYDWHGTEHVGRHDGFQSPIFAWVPSIAVSSLLQVQGFDRRWDGDLLVASLKAQTLFRLRLNKGSVLYSEPIWIGQRIRDLAQLEDGTIILWTDDTDLQFISIDRRRLKQKRRNPAISETMAGDCMYCHHFGPTNATDFAPSLTNVLGRRIASDNFRYSAALRTREGYWTEKLLREFISRPDGFATGTAMPNLHLTDDQLDNVLQDLKNNSSVKSNASQ